MDILGLKRSDWMRKNEIMGLTVVADEIRKLP